MIVRARVSAILEMDYPKSWEDKLRTLDPNNRLYITTEKPASEMSIEELGKFIEHKKTDTMIAEAITQLNESVHILKSLGAEVELRVTKNCNNLIDPNELPF